MNNQSIEPQAYPLAFPHHVGPGTRGLTTALLYSERLCFPLPGWFSNGPISTFARVIDRAQECDHPLTPLWGLVAKHFKEAQAQAVSEAESLIRLRDHVSLVHLVYPGTAAAYSSRDDIANQCIPQALSALADPLYLNTASLEMIWRLWEFALESGCSAEGDPDVDPDRLLRYFHDRALALGGPDRLLAECLLNRFSVPLSTPMSLATDSNHAVAILAKLGEATTSEVEIDPTRLEALSFYLFDRITMPYVDPLFPDYVPKLAALLRNHKDAVISLRNKCKEEALQFLSYPPSQKLFSSALESLFTQMELEASEIAQIDQRSVSNFLRELSKDPKIWAGVSGLLASAVNCAEPVTASIAVASMSLLGAKAFEASSARKRKLEGSDWKFLYYSSKT